MMGKVLYMRKGDKHTAPGSRLPYGYTELAYIQSSGSQHIDSEFVPNQDTRVYAEAVMPIASSTQALFGCRVSSSSQQYQFVTQGGYYRTDYNTTINSFTTHDYGTAKFYLDKDKNVTDLNGEYSSTQTYASFTCPGNMYIFATNNNGAVYALASAKLYCMQIYDNGTLVRDFVPCINDSGAVGLFDMVERKFYGNSGTGTFGAGDVVEYSLPEGYEELAYIQSSGTQYVDTQFAPNQATKIVMDFESAGVPTGYSAGLAALLGARDGSSSNAFTVWFSDSRVYPQYGDVSYSASGYISIDTKQRLQYVLDKNVLSVSGETKECGSAEFSVSKSMCLLGLKSAGEVDARRASGKLYSCKIYDNGACARWYVPAVNPSGGIGLYDVITRAFCGNEGTGTFIGSEVA